MLMKHLNGGVRKGAFDEAAAAAEEVLTEACQFFTFTIATEQG